MATQRATQLDFDSTVIPDRLYFKIGDVARICNVKAYVLRFWETQFPQLKPNKSGTGQRLYRRRDVEMALEIKRLVHGEGFTIAGARQMLEQGSRHREPQQMLPLMGEDFGPPRTDPDAVAAIVSHARAELREIANLLAAPVLSPTPRRARLIVAPTPTESLFPL
jgi:DNA-binding transcriptional MerR regulator